MPLVDASDSRVFHDNYILGTGIWGGAFPNWRQVKLHYHRHVMLPVCDARAGNLVTALGLTAADSLLLVGAGFGWLAERLKRRVPGLTVVCTDTSPWVHAEKHNVETAEIDAIVRAAGLLPGTGKYKTAMTVLDDRGPRAREVVEDLDVLKAPVRRTLVRKYGPFTWALTETLLLWLTDAEALELDRAMHAVAPKVVHMVTPFFAGFDDDPPEPNPWNWKHLEGDATTRASLEALEWYSTTSWKTLLPDSTIVSTGRLRTA